MRQSSITTTLYGILSSLALAAVGLAAAGALGAPTWLMSLMAGACVLAAAVGMASVRRTQARIVDLTGTVAAAPRGAMPGQDAGDEISLFHPAPDSKGRPYSVAWDSLALERVAW